jgi:hypothetical protein
LSSTAACALHLIRLLLMVTTVSFACNCVEVSGCVQHYEINMGRKKLLGMFSVWCYLWD